MSTLPVPSRRTAVLVAVVSASAVALLGLLVDAAWAPLLRLDAAIEDAVHGWALTATWAVDLSRWLDRVGRFGVSFWVTTVTVLVLLAFRRWRLALGVAGIAALAPLVTDWIKVVVERDRPVWEVALGSEPTFSYPSGHATSGLAVYAVCGIALATLLRDRRGTWAVAIASTAFGLLIGVSRVVLGVHWPSDVVGGWCVAIAVAAALYAVLLPLPAPPDPDPVDAPPVDAPTLDAPTLDAPTLDAPTLDAPTLDAPTLDAPAIDAPAIEAPRVEQPPPPVEQSPPSAEHPPTSVEQPPQTQPRADRDA